MLLIVIFSAFGVLRGSCYSLDSNLVCQQCSLWCSAGQSRLTTEGPTRVGKAGPRGPVGPRGASGIVNMTAVETLISQNIEKAIGFLSVQSCRKASSQPAKTKNETGGVFDIYIPTELGRTEVYCDLTTDGGNWVVFQRRMDGSVDFYRDWRDYVNGFGSLSGEFWLGLEIIHQLTKNGVYELRIDMVERDGSRYFAKFSSFKVGPASDQYRLSASGFSGNTSDSFSYHHNQRFSARDNDNDRGSRHCAVVRQGAWWHNDCLHSNLNGMYQDVSSWNGVAWKFGNRVQHMRFTEMKFRERM